MKILYKIIDYRKEEREKYLNSVISLPTYKIENIDYKEIIGKIPIVNETLKLSAPNYATVTGKRLFVVCNLFNRRLTRLIDDSVRKNSIVFLTPYIDIDSVQLKIPTGYLPESIPKDIHLRTSFSNYSITYVVNQNVINMVRKIVFKTAVLPASDYKEVVKYFDALYKSDRGRLVFVKKEN